MSTKGTRRGRDIFVGGSVTGSLIGDKNKDITFTSIGETGSASLDELRIEVALLRAEVEAARGRADTEEVRSELGKCEQELGKAKPDGDMVGIRWKLVHRLLDPLRQVGDIAQIADRIVTLTHILFSGS